MKWTLLVKVDGGNWFFDRGAWEMLKAQVSAGRKPVVPVMMPKLEEALTC